MLKKLYTETPILTIVFFFIFLFHLIFCTHAFYLFGFNFNFHIWGSYHPYILAIYTTLWFFVFLGNNKAAILYILISILALALPYLSNNTLLTKTFGSAMAHLDIIFSTLLLIDYKRFFRTND